MAAQFSVTKGRFLRGLIRWMARATNSFPVPVSPRINTFRMGRTTPSTLPLTPPQSRAAAYDLLEVSFGFDILILNTLNPVAFPEVLYKRVPSEVCELQHRRGNQDRDAGPILPDQLLLKRRAGSEPQTFFM